MWLNLVGMAFKTGATIYKNRQDSRRLRSEAERLHYEKMAKGEVEYQAKIIESNDKGWKDEFVLILISAPIMLLIWSVFSDDPNVKEKIDTFFSYFESLPIWYQALFIGVVSAIYGLKGADIFKRK
jgi:uncharacterized ion transporter superfamily protein YfcC